MSHSMLEQFVSHRFDQAGRIHIFPGTFFVHLGPSLSYLLSYLKSPVDLSLVSILPLFLLVLGLGPMVQPIYATDLPEQADSRPKDEDEDEPDYYEGQDAPTASTLNVEVIARQNSEPEAEAEFVQGPLWMEVTENGFFSSQEEKKISASCTFRIGKRFPLLFPLDIYAQGRFDRDQRNIEWTNHIDAGAGLRVMLSKKVPTAFLTEIVGGEYLRSSLVSTAPQKDQGMASGFFVELHSRFMTDYTWGRIHESIYAQSPWFSFPLRSWGQVRSDLIFSILNRRELTPWLLNRNVQTQQYQNFTMAIQPDIGLLIMEGLAGNLAAYGTVQVKLNTLGDWWNNLATVGPGISYQPLQTVDLYLKTEYLTGQYLSAGRPGAYRPYGKTIHDLRVHLDLKYALGI